VSSRSINFEKKRNGGVELEWFVDAGHCFMLEQVEGWYQVDTLLGLDDLL